MASRCRNDPAPAVIRQVKASVGATGVAVYLDTRSGLCYSSRLGSPGSFLARSRGAFSSVRVEVVPLATTDPQRCGMAAGGGIQGIPTPLASHAALLHRVTPPGTRCSWDGLLCKTPTLPPVIVCSSSPAAPTLFLLSATYSEMVRRQQAAARGAAPRGPDQQPQQQRARREQGQDEAAAWQAYALPDELQPGSAGRAVPTQVVGCGYGKSARLLAVWIKERRAARGPGAVPDALPQVPFLSSDCEVRAGVKRGMGTRQLRAMAC
jgi:hypothetical protein